MLIIEVDHPLLTNFADSSFMGSPSTWPAPRQQHRPSETDDVWGFGITMVVRRMSDMLTFVLIVIFVGTVHASNISSTT